MNDNIRFLDNNIYYLYIITYNNRGPIYIRNTNLDR